MSITLPLRVTVLDTWDEIRLDAPIGTRRRHQA